MLIEKTSAFDAIHTFECGQCFRWNSDEDGVYTGIAGGRVCRVDGREVICRAEDEDFWREYFDLKTDYADVCCILVQSDKDIEKCIDFGSGIRILRQDVWETIVSFIISANNNIPRIKRIIETLCEMYGEEINTEFGSYHSFPTAERLSTLECADLAPLRAGYRDKYILDAAQKVASGEVDIDALCDMDDVAAKKELMKIKGVGGKVADCIMLFSLGRFSVFPKDVWIKRILSEVYGIDEKDTDTFVCQRYGDLAGFAQQYLYYYYRSNS